MNLFLLFIICVACIIIGYFVGYANGFNKCKEIDDNIIEKLANKYKNN